MLRKTLAASLPLLLILMATATVVSKDDDDRRQVAVHVDASKVDIRLERENGTVEDELRVRFEVGPARFDVDYEWEDSSRETELGLVADLDRLAEYRDANGNGRYDAGEALVSAWALGSGADGPVNGTVAWTTPQVSDVDADGRSGKKIVADASFGSGGRFALDMYVFGAFVDLGAASLQPTSVKFDIRIRDYPFVAGDTALVLFMDVRSEAESEIEDGPDGADDDEDGVVAGGMAAGRPAELAFVWKDHADVDGATRPVATTVLREKTSSETEEGETESKSKRSIALSYPRGDSILHDPEFFLTLGAASGTPGPSLLMVAAVAVAAAVVVRGRRA